MAIEPILASKCSHPENAIVMLLSHAPQRLTITEISSLTGYHRNTVRPALKRLVADGKIKFMGKGNHTVYYRESVTDQYHRIAKMILDMDMPELDYIKRTQILRKMGKQMVIDSIQDIMAEKHDPEKMSVRDSLAHLKMSYPFNDLIHTPDGIMSTVEFKIDGAEQLGQFKEIRLQVGPCLCGGNSDNDFACLMVEGALEGGIVATVGYEPHKVEKSGLNGDSNEDYCTFLIQLKQDFYQEVEDFI